MAKIEYPEGIISPEDYRKYLAISKHPILTRKIFVASDGEEYNIGKLVNSLQRDIEHLPALEQEEILERKSKYQALLMKKSRYLAQARGNMGGKPNLDIRKKRILENERDVVELMGRMFTVEEVQKIMIEDNKINITREEVLSIAKTHVVKIEKKREEFRARITDLRLYNKRPRLEELVWMYGKMKNRYITLNGIEAFNAMLRVLEQIRKEAEGDIINIQGGIDINIEVQVQQHLDKEALKTVNLKEVILGRVAARMDYDTTKLVASLHNSYYNKYSGWNGKAITDTSEMDYPSNHTYDFQKIEQRSVEEVQPNINSEPLKPDQEGSSNFVKELLLKKIRGEKQAIENRQSIYDNVKNMAKEDLGKETPIYRGKGGAHDKQPPSKTKRRNVSDKKRDR